MRFNIYYTLVLASDRGAANADKVKVDKFENPAIRGITLKTQWGHGGGGGTGGGIYPTKP